ncbi:DAPG hydrolase family protein [Aquabacterium sp.]|uniref:DAPG hydrolase family protein n=1 Tax=Aquabacterium sp. TaxID=1872578 RepID=UPI003D6D9BBA
MSRPWSFIILARRCLAAAPGVLFAVLMALAGQLPAHAQSISASTSFTVKDVRPEAFSWFWDNVDEAMFKAANSENKAFRWTQAPATPQHLGYSAGARYRATSVFGFASHTVEVSYLDPETVRGRVPSDNHLGSKPYSFVAQSVSVDGKPAFTVLVQYNPVGSTFADSAVRIEATLAAQPAVAQAYVTHLRKTLSGLQPTLMSALNERYFNGVLKTRGSYTIGPVDKNLNVTLVIEQEIKGINAEMLAWWWDHIGDTARYRLWQPIDHVSFEWTVPPNSPDTHYDIGAVQKAKEYIGKSALTLNIKGADPAASPLPPVPVSGDDYFYARTDLTLIAGLLPSNSLVHQWRPNATGDGIILTSTFVNTALARVLNFTFFEDLGSHCLREFQMLPYFLPRLYKREYLHQ